MFSAAAFDGVVCNDTLKISVAGPDVDHKALNVNNNIADEVTDEGKWDKTEDEIKIHPNPTTGKIFIGINHVVVMLQVYNLTGELVMSEHGLSSDNSIDLSGLKNGMYLLVIKMEKKVYTQKVIKR